MNSYNILYIVSPRCKHINYAPVRVDSVQSCRSLASLQMMGEMNVLSMTTIVMDIIDEN